MLSPSGVERRSGAEAELFNQGVLQGGIIGGNDGQSVSGDVFQAGAVQAVFNVNGLFGAAFRGEVLDGEYERGTILSARMVQVVICKNKVWMNK